MKNEPMENLLTRLVEAGKHCEALEAENERLRAEKGGTFQAAYDAILDLQEHLRAKVGYMDAGKFANAHIVKALAATYELQDYLANEIAAATAAGELEPDEEG